MSTQTTKKITVERRGTFNDDSFFKDSWDEWDKAMKGVVDKWESQTGDRKTTRTVTTSSLPAKETKTVYRQIRSSNVTSDESQAVSCTEEDNKYKMVMDVKDFSPEDISVKAVDDTVVVEGKIEKKEGNATSTQKFVRRFLLPPGVNMNAISSALSRDGVLTINAPKLALPSTKGTEKSIPMLRAADTATSRIMGGLSGTGRPAYILTTSSPAAGRPSQRDNSPFNPTGGSNTTVYTFPSSATDRISVDIDYSDRRGHNTKPSTDDSNSKEWTSFNSMVERSQKEMENMMKHHTINPSVEGPTFSKPISSSAVVMAPAGVETMRDVSRVGNTVTERQEQRWDDRPAPGMNRTNMARSEKSLVKDDAGNVIGNKMKTEMESKAEGGREEVLPDGTKCKTFTKSYETKNSYTATSNLAKAL